MNKKFLSIQEAVKKYPRETFAERYQAAVEEREAILKNFPLEAWKYMTLEDYALGLEDNKDNFCRWIEFKSHHLGSIRGGSARKLLIYKHKNKPGWYFDPAYRNEHEAWQAIRSAFVKAFQLAESGDFESIDNLEPLRGGPALKLKVLHLYFPDDILPVNSKAHILHFRSLLKSSEIKGQDSEILRLNRALLAALREKPELKDWHTGELMRFLYQWADPREARRIIKIAPGENAQYWDDCLKGEYICVGWDNVGDLREFESKEVFLERFAKEYSDFYNHHKPTLTKKAKELWTLMELEPGDLIVANKGTSRVLAVGEVNEPGYEWDKNREEFKHLVRVKWNTDYAREIENQKKWAFLTVDKVSPSLFEKIINDKVVLPVDPLLKEIEQAIERKGQVILYGPPGTGKTYQARRFAVWWLLAHEGQKNPEKVLVDRDAFDVAERRLTTVQVSSRVWWVVANPKFWVWENLFQNGKVEYDYGRIKRNYHLVQPGDLVIGYQASPDKRIVALAKISRGLEAKGKEEPSIQLVPVAKVNDGHTLADLQADPVLKNSEPLRFNNQGTLFALTKEESDRLLAQLTERNQEVQDYLEEEDSIGSLTRLTFHPSYSYEDFIEGFKPVDTAESNLVLRLEDGVFKRLCNVARANPGKKYLLMVDEINRANIAKVFGEIITLLEKDKRNLLITLPQSKHSFTIPPNVYLLGTMNTADRSIKLLDAALRRRFAFLELMPEVDILRGAKVEGLPLDDFLVELNRRIAQKEGREKQIGHAYLLENGQPVDEVEELARRFRQEILPLLQEFCYDDYTTLAYYLGKKIVDEEAHSLNMEILENPYLLLESLEEEFIRSGGAE